MTNKTNKKQSMNRILILVAMMPVFATADTYYASPDGTGTGSEESPYSLSAGISKVNKSTHVLILKRGRYALTGAIGVTGASANGNYAKIFGETGDPADVILDAQGGSEVMRLAKNVLVSGVTMMNGCNASSAVLNRAAGVRIGYNDTPGTLSIVSNCVITCCTNAFTDSTKSGTTVVYGGAVCVYDTGLLVDSVVTNNTADYRSAGVVMVNGTMRGCTVADNTAEDGGGGIFCERDSTAYIADSTISGNSAGTSSGAVGGGVACYFPGSSFVLTNCTVAGNSAHHGGGVAGRYDETLHAEIVDCIITNNVSDLYGGGVFMRDNNQNDLATRFVMRNSLVAFNRSIGENNGVGGGVYFVSYANPIIDSCTIVSNRCKSSSNGAGLYHRWGGTVTNTIIACNLKGGSMETGSAWCLNVGTPSDAYRNCCAWPEASSVFLAENGCVNADPKFADAAHGDFTLTKGSPCKNAGILESWMDCAFDLAGNARVYADIPDIGCYELNYPIPGMLIFVR